MRISYWSSDVCSSDLEKELGFLDSEKVSDQERTRLGQALGADYLLILNLTQAGVATKVTETHVDMTGESSREVSHSRSEERRVGKEWVSTCRSRGTTDP